MSLTPRLASARPVGVEDILRRRADFPVLGRTVHGKPLVYFDNAATTQKPRAVMEAMTRFYTGYNANVHRGIHLLAELATDAYEQSRRKVQRLLNAADPGEVVFVRGATEAINLVAQSYGRTQLKAGDEIVVSTMEHHANIVPWLMLCAQTGAVLRVIPITDEGELMLDEYERLLGPRTRLVAVTHVSNVLGTINPVAEIAARAHACGARVLVDGAQAVGHMQVNVQAIDADFYVFSGHKVYGPTGIGALYGKAELLERMPPYQGGGDMIREVTFETVEYADPPGRFEAGTPNIAGAVGLGAAIDYLGTIGMELIAEYEADLLAYATERLSDCPGLRLLGQAVAKAAVLSFVLEGVHPHDVGTILDHEGVAIRTGHHCCQPLMRRMGVDVTSRASLAWYNTVAEIDLFAEALCKIQRWFA